MSHHLHIDRILGKIFIEFDNWSKHLCGRIMEKLCAKELSALIIGRK
ncbi:hypothetical protein SAMN05661091_2950 [Paenibacillus uliginis N3/975]|uniref:Uncharacterized protein n=1 Tax=Paenibacillus uliginis N3/975 TaxID=1313296 RepID=A0A1X7HFE1_9BACL|nr:hypothetical protein SAMN05661091_2950 [Paenibacillus uliginis N3/975]